MVRVVDARSVATHSPVILRCPRSCAGLEGWPQRVDWLPSFATRAKSALLRMRSDSPMSPPKAGVTSRQQGLTPGGQMV